MDPPPRLIPLDEAPIWQLDGGVDTTAPREPHQWKARSVTDLVELYKACWNETTRTFDGVPFDVKGYQKYLNEYFSNFPIILKSENAGYVEKKLLPVGTEIFVRADLHGDLKTLIENLSALQDQGLLDEHFRCLDHLQMVFLGDYMDRGEYCVHVLQLLLALRIENPANVTLIRGNHEEVSMNRDFGRADLHLKQLLESSDGRMDLQIVYQTLPLAAYFAVNKLDKQYVQFAHGLFELHVDLFSLLSSSTEYETFDIPHNGELSSRVAQLMLESPKEASINRQLRLKNGATRIASLLEQHRTAVKKDPLARLSPYNWGDMQDENEATLIEDIGLRKWLLHPTDVKHYFNVNSPIKAVRLKLLFRGHEHIKQNHFAGKKIVAITLPTGTSVAWAQASYPNQFDEAYVLKMQPKVKDWTKTSYFRFSSTSTTYVTMPKPIREAE